MRIHGRTDANQKQIIKEIEAAGYTVESLANKGDGFPDIVVGGIDRHTGLRFNWLFEIKVKKGQLTPDQKDWHGWWRGQCGIIRSSEDAFKLMGVIKCSN